MYRVLLCLCIGFLFAACSGQKGDQLPEDLIERNLFKQVLFEIQLCDASLGAGDWRGHQLNHAQRRCIERICAAKNIAIKDLENTFDYYSEHPVLLLSIYEELLQQISKKEAEIKAAPTTENEGED